jgi:hypothetical protein
MGEKLLRHKVVGFDCRIQIITVNTQGNPCCSHRYFQLAQGDQKAIQPGYRRSLQLHQPKERKAITYGQ